jgi:hypothetical protein
MLPGSTVPAKDDLVRVDLLLSVLFAGFSAASKNSRGNAPIQCNYIASAYRHNRISCAMHLLSYRLFDCAVYVFAVLCQLFYDSHVVESPAREPCQDAAKVRKTVEDWEEKEKEYYSSPERKAWWQQ